MTSLFDLTQPIQESIPVWPGDPLFQKRSVASHDDDGFMVSSWTLGSHLGTHLDAPIHYFSDGEPLDALPMDLFWGPAAVLDLTDCLNRSQDQSPTEIRVEDLAPYEKILETESRILLRTDWDPNRPALEYFTQFPSLLPETVDWLADYPIRLLGLETPSLCAFEGVLKQNEESPLLDEVTLHADAECHRILLGRRPPIVILEGLVHLKQLPPRITLSCFPLSVTGADGSPVRAVAFVD